MRNEDSFESSDENDFADGPDEIRDTYRNNLILVTRNDEIEGEDKYEYNIYKEGYCTITSARFYKDAETAMMQAKKSVDSLEISRGLEIGRG